MTNPIIQKPWGEFTILNESNYYKVKRIVVKSGAALSLQSHQHRSEHWVIVEGQAEVTLNNEKYRVMQNESIFIPKLSKHRLANLEKKDLIVIEVQVGEYLGEDDIVRYEDMYDRCHGMTS